MKRSTISALAAAFLITASGAVAADPIEGKWLRPSTGTLVEYKQEDDQFCGTVLSGEYQGQSIGCLQASGSGYRGKVIALDENKTYAGKATVSGDVLQLKGCVAIFCKGEDWQRQ